MLFPGLAISVLAMAVEPFADFSTTLGAGGGPICADFVVLGSVWDIALAGGRALIWPGALASGAEFLATNLFGRFAQRDLRVLLTAGFRTGLVQTLLVTGAGGSLGEILTWLTSAAGLTPAEIAALAAAAESGGCFTAPRRSGLTTICRS